MVEIFFIDTSPLLAHYWSNETSEPLNFTGMPDRAHSINFVLNVRAPGPTASALTSDRSVCALLL